MKIGTQVELNSCSDYRMTVVHVFPNEDVKVVWFDGNGHLQNAVLPTAAIRIVK